MRCEHIERLMGVHGDLDRAERRTVAEHLRSCDRCRAAWHDEQRVRHFIAAIPVLDTPPGLEARLLNLAKTPTPPGSGIGAGPGAIGTTRLAALVAAVAIGASVVVPLLRGEGGAGAGSVPPAHGGLHAPSAPHATVVARAADVDLVTPNPSAVAEPRTAPDTAAAVAMAPDAPSLPSAALPAATAPSADEPSPAAPPPAALSGSQPTAEQRPTGRQRGGDAPTPSVETPLPTPPPDGCAVVALHVFADVAGAGPLDCPGCDGVRGDDDARLAAARGLSLPPMQVAVFDADGEVLYEARVASAAAASDITLPELCGAWPLTVQLAGLPADWLPCPSSGGLERALTSTGPAHVTYPLSPECPAPTPTASPTASATATATLEVAASPSPTETPLPTEDPDPDPNPGPDPTSGAPPEGPTPNSVPTDAPRRVADPSRTPAPTVAATEGVAAVTATPRTDYGTPVPRLRRTATPMPTREIVPQRTPLSWAATPTASPTPWRQDPRVRGRR